MLLAVIVCFNNLSSLFDDKDNCSCRSIFHNIQYFKSVLTGKSTGKLYFHFHGNMNLLEKHIGKDLVNVMNRKNRFIYMHSAFTQLTCEDLTYWREP